MTTILSRIVAGLAAIRIMVSDMLSGEPTIGISSDPNISLLSALATATDKNAAPRSLGILVLVFIVPPYLDACPNEDIVFQATTGHGQTLSLKESAKRQITCAEKEEKTKQMGTTILVGANQGRSFDVKATFLVQSTRSLQFSILTCGGKGQ